MSQTMRAWFAVPGPEGAKFELRETAVPAPGPGQVLIAVRAAGTNRGELIRGAQNRAAGAEPTRAGGEFAGEIAALGEGVSGFKVGDRVMGRTAGSYAQYVAASRRALMRIPDGMAWAEAGAIPNVFVTAHDALVTNGATAVGESVLVTAGPSGVGTAAIQIARHIGANPVIATTRTPSKAAALRALGAHEVVETREDDWPDRVLKATGARGGVDVIIDHVGGPMLPGHIRVLALKGRLVSVGRNAGRVGDCDLDEIARKRAHIIGVTFRSRTPEESLACSERFAAHLLEAVARGALKPVLDRTFPFERLTDAHAYMLSDAQTGKIVLTM